MPLLRLTSLIVTTLLLAALSAFVPAKGGSRVSLSNQTDAGGLPAVSSLAEGASSAASTQRQASSAQHSYQGELIRAAGQSIPRAGQ